MYSKNVFNWCGIGMIYFYNPIKNLMRREDIKSMVIGSIGIAPSLFYKGKRFILIHMFFWNRMKQLNATLVQDQIAQAVHDTQLLMWDESPIASRLQSRLLIRQYKIIWAIAIRLEIKLWWLFNKFLCCSR